MTYYLLEDLCQDTNELVIDQLATFQRWILQSPDLLLDNDLERLCTDKQRRRRTGRVVENGADVTVLDLVERIDGLDAVVEQLMEHKADTCTTRQLVQREVARVTIDRCPELRAELRNHGQHDVGRAVVAQGTTQRLQFRVVLLQLL